MDSVVEERVQQQAIHQVPAYLFSGEQGILSGRPRGAELLEELMEHLLSGPTDAATPLDFSRVSFMDVSCADEMLNKLLLRLTSGEIGHRYVYIAEANVSVRETIAAVLQLRDLAALYKDGAHVELLGGAQDADARGARCAASTEVRDLGRRFPTRSAKTSTSSATASMPYNASGWCAACAMGRSLAGGRQFYYVSIV